MATIRAASYFEVSLQRYFLLTHDNAAVSHVFLFAFAAWALWRFWRFTLYPKLHPDEPLEIPYLVPRKLCCYVASLPEAN